MRLKLGAHSSWVVALVVSLVGMQASSASAGSVTPIVVSPSVVTLGEAVQITVTTQRSEPGDVLWLFVQWMGSRGGNRCAPNPREEQALNFPEARLAAGLSVDN